jgi:hypothetical protein
MEHNSNTGYTLISIFSGVLSWITLADAQYAISFTASMIAMISGIMALRYYYYAGNEKRNQLNKDRDGK